MLQCGDGKGIVYSNSQVELGLKKNILCVRGGVIWEGNLNHTVRELSPHNKVATREAMLSVKSVKSDLSNKIRNWQELEQERIWTVMWGRTSSSGLRP